MISKIRMSEHHWLLAIAAVWVLVLSASSFDRFLPASIWFKVRQVHVFDAKVGDSPLMAVEHTIYRPFQAQWIAEVEKWNGTKFVLINECTGRGSSNYSPENDFPEPLDMDWWVFPADCQLTPGQYRIETRWELSGGQQVRAVSNLFAVTN